MYYILRILLWILAILIAVFQVKAYKYNIRNRNLIIASLRKDIRPYWLLWWFWLILFLFMLFFKWISVNWWWYVSEQIGDWKNFIINNRNNSDNKNRDIKNETWNNSVNTEYNPIDSVINTGSTRHVIISEEQVQQIKNRNNIEILPVTDGYYEIVTSDEILISKSIDTSRYIIPKPIDVKSCDVNNTYRNLRWKLWVNYNGFVYEYINSHKQNNVLVAILDSGIDGDNKVLQWHLAVNSGEIKDWKDIDDDWYIDDIAWVNVVSNDWNIQDYNWHGTHVAWIVLQTFPNASILPIKVSEWDSEYVDEYSIIKWLRYAIDADVDVINMSFWWEWFNEVTQKLIDEAVEKWIIVLAAAGNEWNDISIYYPASYTWAISVGSVWYDWISSFSNYVADVLAPWECIYSYWLNDPLEFWWWTSMSAPHLAWLLWTYLSFGKTLWNESDILSILNKASKTENKVKVVDAPKLYWIEKDNNNVYSYIGKIKTTLETIKTKLNKLQNSTFTEYELNSVASYKSTLSSNANNIWNLYSKLWMTTWFGLELKKEIEEYNKILWQLNIWWLFLETNWWTLSTSLWVDTCIDSDLNKCWRFSRIIRWWSKLPASNNNVYTTMYDNQTEVRFNIYQWENDIANLNTYLWTITVYWLQKWLRWTAWAIVYFNVDWNWKLSVRAVDKDNSNNVMTTTINAVKRNTVIVTWDNYYKAKSLIDELLPKTEKMLLEIQTFYNLNPFDYIPKSVTWSYQITKIDLDIPEYVDVNTWIDEQLNTWVEIQLNTWINKESWVNLSWTVSILSWLKSKINENIKVDSVIDGDTIRVFMNWKSVKVRLIWVDAPESTDTRYWYTECFWNESTNYLKNLLSNKTIWLEYDLTQWMYDKYDRALAYVFLNWENINKKIIEDGYWREYTYNLPYKYQKEFKSAQRNAESLNKWLWNMNTCEWDRKPNY